MEYTAIGATVNLASRLCDTAKRGEVIVSAEVYEQLRDRIAAQPRPPVRVKNIDRDLATYLVTALDSGRGLAMAVAEHRD
jgi:adenylate cyclase